MKQHQIKSIAGDLLFEYKCESVKECLIQAVKSRADLSGANLSWADLSGANLSGADLSGADLSGAEGLTQDTYNRKTHLAQGTIKAWKKVKDDYIIALEIPETAKRVHSISSRKCRAEFAKVLEIKKISDNSLIESIENHTHKPYLTYKVGEMVYPDKYDDSFFIECSNGINFFITEIEALEY